jgi:hypothetical protein
MYQPDSSAADTVGIAIKGAAIDSNITVVINMPIKDFFIFLSSLDVAQLGPDVIAEIIDVVLGKLRVPLVCTV